MEWEPTPIFLPEEFHAENPGKNSTWDHKESDTSEWLTHILMTEVRHYDYALSLVLGKHHLQKSTIYSTYL